MKKIYLLLLFISPLILCAQPYFNDGATWYYSKWPHDTVSYIKIEKTGEVWMGGKLCDELKFSDYNPSANPLPEVSYEYSYGSGDTVFLYKVHNNTFGILYDFTAQSGDTVSCIYCNSAFVVDSISYLFIGNSTLEAQHTHLPNSSFKFTLYEKIGHTGYFIPWFDMNNPSMPGWRLRCYQDNEGLYLHTGESESCDDGNASHDTASIHLVVAPYAISIISEAIEPGTEISVYDVCGRLVVREYATQNTTCYIEMQLDARAIYCLTVRNGNELLADRFVLVNPW